jgi:hypothetical protein
MIIGVAHHRNALPFALSDRLPGEPLAKQIAKSLGAILVTLPLDERIKGRGNVVIKRNRKALHNWFTSVQMVVRGF